MAAIWLERINKSFPGVKALVDISQQIETGQFFTLLGPSGCGKTTLLRTVAGFYRQDSGHVYIADQLVDDIPAYRRNTGMVFQNYAVFPHMSVFENVAFGLKTRKVPGGEIKRRVAQVLEMARLTGYEERTPDQLSGGQQQRIGLARAMVIEPQVLLMDEPLSNLDAKLRVEMREEIRDIQRALGTTTLYVTHDQEEALVISDRIAVMNAGMIHQVGTAWEVYKQPADTFVASFVGISNFLDGSIAASGNGTVEVQVGELRVKVPAPAQPRERLRLAVRPEELVIVPEATAVAAGATSIPGKVIKRTFTGTLVQYLVEAPGGLQLLAERHKPSRDALIPPGTAVCVQVPVEAVLVFDPETGARL
jgi:iron(III) transport system ATP-binding protein